MAHDVIMPALGMAQDSGLITAWLVAPGGRVVKGAALFEVETDKATVEVEAQADGYLSAVTAQAGEEVPVGQVIARIVATPAEDGDAAGAPALASGASPGAAIVLPVAPGPVPQAETPGHSVIMPALGMAQDTGLITAWLAAPGDTVTKGAALFEVETDKATVEVEAPASGFLSAVTALAGDEVPVGRVIARIVASAAEVVLHSPHAAVVGALSPVAAPAVSAIAPSAPSQRQNPAPPSSFAPGSAARGPVPGATGSTRILASPKARAQARARGLDLARLVGMGRPQPYHVADLAMLESAATAPGDFAASPSTRALAGRLGVDLAALAARTGRSVLAREDVEAAAQGQTAPAPASAPSAPSPWDVDHAAWGPVRSEKLSRFAMLTAANLAVAHRQIPAVTHHDSADMRAVESLRAALKARGQKVTALAFHVAALARALREFPRFNASLGPTAEELVFKEYVHIGIAVDTPHGLVVPVIRDADRKAVAAIGEEIGALASRAQARRLRPDDMGGGSMSITNLGGIGGESFTPIVNPPEVAILGITRTEIRPVWDGAAFQPVPMSPLDLSYDHRVINGAEAARFLARYRDIIGRADELVDGKAG